MSEAQTQETCPKCQMPRQKSASGRLTQWMLVCKCFTAPQELDTPDVTVEICGDCGKRIHAGRAGSLTQWIFRADLCSCDVPFRRDPSTIIAADADADAPPASVEELPVLDLASANFPSERYCPHSVIGQGTSGCVYLCTDKLLEKQVAVKVLHNLSPSQLISFQREAKATSQLRHTGIVTVLDFGATANGYPYMVLEFIEGTSLELLIAEHGPLEARDAVFIAEKLVDALAYAHVRGVCHRDIKPSNVIIEREPSGAVSARLIDFGVGILKNEPAFGELQAMTIVGTPAYMSPDQALGRSFDNRSDVYSIGCVLFRMLTGSPPFVGATALETISMHAHRQPPFLSQICDGEFPEQLEDVVAKCLQKSQDDRFQNMEELKDALSKVYAAIKAFERNRQLEQTPTGSIEQARHGYSKRSKLLALSAVLCTISVVCGAIVLVSTRDAPPPALKPESKSVPKLRDVFDFGDKVWRSQPGDFNYNIWMASPEAQDKDFKLLLKENNVKAVLVTAHSPIDGSGFKHIRSLPLEYINVQSPCLTDRGFCNITGFKTLLDLRLAQTTLVTLRGYRTLNSVPNLLLVDLMQVKLPNEIFEILSKMRTLKAISLAKSGPITKEGLTRLASLPSLEFIDLTGTEIDNSYLPVLAKFKRMEALRLDELNLTDENLECLRQMPLLNTVKLSKSGITDKGMAKLARIKTLRSLAIDDCEQISPDAVLKLEKRGVRIIHSETDLSIEEMYSQNLP